MREWQAKFYQTDEGIKFGGARRNEKSIWRPAEKVPARVREFLELVTQEDGWYCAAWTRLEEMQKWAKVDKATVRNGRLYVRFRIEDSTKMFSILPLMKRLGKDLNADSLYGLYRVIHQKAACDPIVAFLVGGHRSGLEWISCERLRPLGSFSSMSRQSLAVYGMSITGYIEGREGIQPVVLLGDSKLTEVDVWNAVRKADENTAELILSDTSSITNDLKRL